MWYEVRLRHVSMMNKKDTTLDYKLRPYISRAFVSPLEFSKRAILHGSNASARDVKAIGFNARGFDYSSARASHATFNGGVHPKATKGDKSKHHEPSSLTLEP
jgi:hypothetical protein